MFLLNLKMWLGVFYHFFLEGERKSPNLNSLLNSATCWDKEGGVVNQLSSLGRKIIVISFFKKMIIISYMISKWLTTTPSPSFIFFFFPWQLKLILKGKAVEIFTEYNPDALNVNPLTKETADLGGWAPLIMPCSVPTSYTHHHMSVSVLESS